MNAMPIYITLTVSLLAIIAGVVLFADKNRNEKRLSAMASIAFACILAGLFYSDDRLIGYSLLGGGVAIAILDMIRKSRKPQGGHS